MPVFSAYDPRSSNPSFAAWLDAAGSRPAAIAAAADLQLLLAAYKEHRCVDFFDYTSYTAVQLHPHSVLTSS